MPADSSLCSPDALVDKQARKGQTRVKGQMESKFDADDVFAGAHGDGDGRRATGDTARCGWRVDDSWQGSRGKQKTGKDGRCAAAWDGGGGGGREAVPT